MKGEEEKQSKNYAFAIKSAQDKLRPDKLKIYLSLHDCKNYPGDLKHFGIFETNALGIGLILGSEVYDVDFAAVFSDISRINHR